MLGLQACSIISSFWCAFIIWGKGESWNKVFFLYSPSLCRASNKLTILLPQSFINWDCRQLCLTHSYSFDEFRYLNVLDTKSTNNNNNKTFYTNKNLVYVFTQRLCILFFLLYMFYCGSYWGPVLCPGAIFLAWLDGFLVGLHHKHYLKKKKIEEMT